MNARFPWNLRAALTLLLGASLIPVAMAQPTPPPAQTEEAVKLDKFEVTGSRVKRTDIETTQPVLTITAGDMEMTGYSTVADALRSLPMNSGQSLTPVSSGTSFTPGISSFNLRGLGNNNVLVLVNGRRSAPFGASGFNGMQTMFDLNSLPLSAIESIELLKDGGSAIYGSDAVSGVINVKLKKSGNGGNLTVSVGNTIETDSLEKSANMAFFTGNGRTSVVVTMDWQERNAIFARDLDFTSNADLRNIGGINRASTSAYPGLVYVPSIGGYRTFLAPTTTPTTAAAVPLGTANGDVGAGYYNFLRDSDTFPATRQTGFYTRLDHEFTDKLALFGEFTFRRAETVNHSAAAPMFSYNEQGYSHRLMTSAELGGAVPDPANRAHYDLNTQIGTGADGILIPAYNPFNPWQEDLPWDNRVRFVTLGPRVNNVTSDSPRFLLGLKGDLDIINDTWTWEAAVNYSKSTYTNISFGAQDRKVQAAFHGVTFGAGTPEAVTLYLNPFGPSDQRILDYISIRNPTTSSYLVRGWDVAAQGEIFTLPAGAIGLAVGGEYRDETLRDYRTALNEQGQIIGGSEGSSVFGSREVYSAYAELNIPVLKQVELQIAGRFEDYSDFGRTTKPKFSVKVTPFKDLILRASYGESFLAPNLPYLYSTQSTSFTSAAIVDPRRPSDAATQIKTLGGGNPDLQPEETETYYVGLVYEVPFVKGLELSADYFVFDSTNLITSFSANEILAGEAAGNPIFTPLVVRNPPAAGQTVGTIQYVMTSWSNAATRKYKGSDYGIAYNLRTSTIGDFRFQASATYLDELSFGGFNSSGSRLYPRVRANFGTSWQYGDWGASLFVNYTGYRYGTGQMQGAARVTNSRYSSQVLVNPQVSYRGFARTRITLGVRNALDREPPVDFGEAERWTPGVNNPEPLYWYARVSRDF